jgi:hypothetical protein
MEPADPMDRIDPAEPIDKMDPLDPMLRIDPAEPTERHEPSVFRTPHCYTRTNPALNERRTDRSAQARALGHTPPGISGDRDRGKAARQHGAPPPHGASSLGRGC